MTNEKYTETQKKILELMSIVRELDLEDFIDSIHRAEAVGPMIDPTMYRAGSQNLQMIKELAEGLQKFKESFPDVQTVVKGFESVRTFQLDAPMVYPV